MDSKSGLSRLNSSVLLCHPLLNPYRVPARKDPIVSAFAFKAFVCYDFADGAAYLVADVSVTCGSEDHQQSRALAWLAIALHPVGNLVLVALLFS